MSHVDQELFELRQRVEKLENKVAHLFENLGIAPRSVPSPSVSPEVLDLVRRGRKIEAIKLYRQETGASLKGAKDVIDSLNR